MIPRATIDTNIYVSALVYRGNPLRLLDLAAAGGIEVAISGAIMAETLRILRNKFGWSAERLEGARELILSFASMVSPSNTLDAVQADMSDNRIVECAVAAGSEVIITGDSHLLDLSEYRGIKVVRVADFLRGFQTGQRR